MSRNENPASTKAGFFVALTLVYRNPPLCPWKNGPSHLKMVFNGRRQSCNPDLTRWGKMTPTRIYGPILEGPPCIHNCLAHFGRHLSSILYKKVNLHAHACIILICFAHGLLLFTDEPITIVQCELCHYVLDYVINVHTSP